MRHDFLLYIILLLLNFTLAEAQTDVKIRKKDFKNDKSGFDEAWKHVSGGDLYYSEKGIWYSSAYDEYLQALVYNNSNAELNYKAGVAALFSDNKEDAAEFLLKAYNMRNDVAEDVLLLTGRALQYSGRYTDAVEKFNSYINSQGKKPKELLILVNKYIEECESALIVTKDTFRISLINIGPNINSATDDYSEVITAQGKSVFFASRREIPKSGGRYPDTKFNENIFYSEQVNGVWQEAVIAGKEITTSLCETPLYITSGKDSLFLYSGYVNGGDIMLSVNKKGVWRPPQKLPFDINTKGSETSFSFSPSGDEIYYVSDNGKEIAGGKDIFFIKKVNDRKWSKPMNAGSKINTPYDEESVRFSGTGDTLWFSSRGHNSIGGFDIFYTVRNRSGEWDSVKNLGYPVNTPWDEIFYYPAPQDDSAFYFSSNRTGGFGGLDIYFGRILPPERKEIMVPPVALKHDTVYIIKEVPSAPAAALPLVVALPVKQSDFYLAGKITDSDSGEPVLAKIDVLDLNTRAILKTTASSDVDGKYRVILPQKKAYLIDIRSPGYLSDLKRIDIPENWPNDLYNLNIDLIKVKVGKKVVLNNILFETGKAILTPGSFTELNRLLNIMKENENMKIEISGHTDKTGSEPLNFKLSENRAKAVLDFLVQNGINQARIESRGFGSLQPVTENATPQGRAKNRRVEFKILEF
jgi:outer membrane protein OmpA-like peptidoglycan-associated protein/tetratricopeptide (TPR) repeat protein